MTQPESDRIEALARWYHEEQLDFDKRLISYRYRTLKSHLVGKRGLEVGPAEGQMTQFLVADFDELHVLEASASLLDTIPAYPNLRKHHGLAEEFDAPVQFDTVVMEHILEHVDDPVGITSRARSWLAPGGRLLAGVPNGHSFHRLAAVKMGLLDNPCQLDVRDHALGHRRVYTPESFRADLEMAGWRVIELTGVFFKPVTNGQIQAHWTPAMMEGFYELGKDFPRHAAELMAVCVPR